MTRAEADVRTDLNQSTWWKTADGLIHEIDKLEPRHRANIARLLVDTAARRFLQKEYRWYTWDAFFGGLSGYDSMPDEVADELLNMTDEDIRRHVRRDIDRGKHLEMIWTSPLFIKMVSPDVEAILRTVPWYAGTLPAVGTNGWVRGRR